MAYVVAATGEPFEALYRHFKRQVDADGILGEYRRSRHFISRSEERYQKRRRAERRRARLGVG